jgi:hypothetical protein
MREMETVAETRRELLQYMLSLYREASSAKEKSNLLDIMTRSNGLQSQVRDGASQPCASGATHPSAHPPMEERN